MKQSKRRAWTPAQKAAASERARARLAAAPSANPAENVGLGVEAFQRRSTAVAERTEQGSVLIATDNERWPSGAVKRWVLGYLVPEGMYHTVVNQIPASYELGSAFDKIESSGKGYKWMKVDAMGREVDLGPSKRIYICEQSAFDERARSNATKARSRVVGVAVQPGMGGDVKSVTTRSNYEGVDMEAFLAQRQGGTQLSTADLLTAADQARLNQEEV